MHEIVRRGWGFALLFGLFLTFGWWTGAKASGRAPAVSPMHGMAPNPTGGMARWRFMIGRWTCTSAQASSSFPITLTILAAPNDALETFVRSPAMSASGFFGYDAASKSWWSAYTDNSGDRYFETSRDGSTFAGTMMALDHTAQIRGTTTQSSATKFHTITEVRSGTSWVKLGDTSCTKS